MSPADRDVLIVRYLDGTAGPDEVAALSALLKEDADARALIRDASLQALALADFGRSRALQGPRRPAPEARWNPRLLAAATSPHADEKRQDWYVITRGDRTRPSRLARVQPVR